MKTLYQNGAEGNSQAPPHSDFYGTVCRICGAEKAPHNFICPACWGRLPRELRAPFRIHKLRCFNWLRQEERRSNEAKK
jgi:hypothetical protein